MTKVRLYEAMILDHNKNPRGFYAMDGYTRVSHGVNSLCGDDYYVYIFLENNKVKDISFHGCGCAISKSSGSLMVETLKGKSLEEAKYIKDQFLNFLLTSSDIVNIPDKLMVFQNVKKFPIRIKCATLVWRAFEDLMNQDGNVKGFVTTEQEDDMEDDKKNLSLNHDSTDQGQDNSDEKNDENQEKKSLLREIDLTAMPTPNPNTVKFLVNYTFFKMGSLCFLSPEESKGSILIDRLFSIEGLLSIMIGSNFISITKDDEVNWEFVIRDSSEAIKDVLSMELIPINQQLIDEMEQSYSVESNSEVINKINKILTEEIRPAIAMDGGDCYLHSYEEGKVYLKLQGACSSCPSATLTLKMGIENRLREDIPEILEVLEYRED